MMTAREMNAAIGKQVMFVAKEFRFLCTVKDAKVSFGQPRLLIAPVNGSGEQWVEFSSIEPAPMPVAFVASKATPFQTGARYASIIRNAVARS